MRLLKSLLWVGVSILLAHFLWSAIVVGLLNSYYSHRLINILKSEDTGTQWEEMTSAFVNSVLKSAEKDKNPVTLFIGSSVTYGYPWQEQVIFSRVVAERLSDWKVANLSVIGVGVSELTAYVTCPLTGPRKPAIVIAEIPLVNSIGEKKPGYARKGQQCAAHSSGDIGYWQLVASRPYGLGWISLLWDEESYEKHEENIVISPVPPGYFATAERFESIRSQYEIELTSYLDSVSTMGDKVLVYVSPVYTLGIGSAGGEQSAVEHQIQFTYDICRKHGKVICLDSSPFGARRDFFFNLTHLNQRGHKAMAEWFEQQIRKYQ